MSIYKLHHLVQTSRKIRKALLFVKNQDLKALYAFNELGKIEKVYGSAKAPQYLTDKHISKYYKYQSSSRMFNPIVGNKGLSIAVDAVVLKHTYSGNSNK